MTQTIDPTGAVSTESADYIARGLEHLWVHTAQYNALAEDDGLIVIESGEGIYLRDSKGRQFVDSM